VLVPSLFFMPDSFYARMHSIDSYNTDSSFQGRVAAWHVAYDYARDHFPFGAGFYGPQLAELFHRYQPEVGVRAAHSIYFQVLGEQGFVGLLLYLLILAAAFLKARRIHKACKGDTDKAWAGDLTAMIQLGLLVFCLSGAALSMAYYDVLVLYLAMLVSLQEQVVPVAVASRALTRRPVPLGGLAPEGAQLPRRSEA
jgi:probable O-glycosylation ligase (exosortase A-associated)